MKRVRLLALLLAAGFGVAAFSGCETQRSACEREKRLTERMDEMEMNIDTRISGVNSEMADLRSNPPVVVQQIPAPSQGSIDSITVEDDFAVSKREQLEELARQNREQVIYATPPASSRSGGNIRVPVPARTVQAALKEAGFYNGAIDGKVGRGTIAAISSFQRSQGIKADGIVGRVTWQHLQAFVPAGMSTTRLK
jgi:hypothetical protein